MNSKLKYGVFLGGSCNPTTWRQDKVIPFLTKLHVKYFDPQVDEWTLNLIEEETKAKDESLVLLWNITRETRSPASLIEVAYILNTDGNFERFVLCMEQIGKKVRNELLSAQEICMMKCARNTITCFANNRGIKVLKGLDVALQMTKKKLFNRPRGILLEKSDFSFSVSKTVPTRTKPLIFDITEDGINVRMLPESEILMNLLLAEASICSDSVMMRNLISYMNQVRKESIFEEFSKLVNKVWHHDPNTDTWNNDVIVCILDESHQCLCLMLWITFFLSLIPEAVVFYMVPLISDDLSENAMNDYNRARGYIGELARIQNVEIQDDLPGAIRATMKKFETFTVEARVHFVDGHNF